MPTSSPAARRQCAAQGQDHARARGARRSRRPVRGAWRGCSGHDGRAPSRPLGETMIPPHFSRASRGDALGSQALVCQRERPDAPRLPLAVRGRRRWRTEPAIDTTRTNRRLTLSASAHGRRRGWVGVLERRGPLVDRRGRGGSQPRRRSPCPLAGTGASRAAEDRMPSVRRRRRIRVCISRA
jgi:hypothetical protein